MKLERRREPETPAPPGRPEPTVLAVGNFDGVHLGHQRGLELARKEAQRRGIAFGAVTFEPHPARLLRPKEAPGCITPLALKAEFLESAGVERLTVVEFTERFAAWSPEDFVDRLVGRLGARAVVQGANFRFGRDRSGDVALLRRLGAERGFEVLEAADADFEGRIISSTRIREELARGEVEVAKEMLGRPYEVGGEVVQGAGRGHDLGFPTANVDADGDVLIPDGAYVGDARVRGGLLPAVVHKGPRPTFGDSPTLEAHLIGARAAPSYLRVRFHSYLRPIQAFEDAAALMRQIDRDVARALDGRPD